jgi:hypothetical protein
MKKVLYFLFIISLLFFGCTDNDRVKNWGGTATIDLQPGEQFINVTWKDGADIWYLTTPYDSAYIPKTYKFHQKTSYGTREGTYIIKEH